MRSVVLLIYSLPAGGCAALAAGGGSTTASTATSAVSTISAMPKPSNFDYVSKSNTRLEFVNPAALLTGSTRIDAKVIEEQCAHRTADPPFVVPNDKAAGSWSLAGRLP